MNLPFTRLLRSLDNITPHAAYICDLIDNKCAYAYACAMYIEHNDQSVIYALCFLIQGRTLYST